MARAAALSLFALLLVAVACLPHSATARALKQNGETSIITPGGGSSTSRSAITGEGETETSANSQPGGVHRLTAPSARRSYAVAQSTSSSLAPRNALTAPRVRSAQDTVSGGANLGSGSPSKPALVMGGMSAAQTYEGATAIASTGAVAMNGGGNNAVANSRRVAVTGTLRGARGGISYSGTNANGVGSLAMSGLANGKIVLAQGEQAVAMSQTERN